MYYCIISLLVLHWSLIICIQHSICHTWSRNCPFLWTIWSLFKAKDWYCFWHLLHCVWYCFDNYFTYLFQYCYKYCYSDIWNLWAVMQSDSTQHFLKKCLYQVRVITVFTVIRLLTDFVCIYTYEFWLSLCKIVRSSVILLLPLFKEEDFLEIDQSETRIVCDRHVC